jgi:photosystem II stability/assembly factor-like uncharacterized protein
MGKVKFAPSKALGFVLLFVFFSTIILAQTTSWKSSGPYGGHIDCLTLSKSNPEILYAGTKHGIYKTENGGETWTRTQFPTYHQVRSIKVHVANPDIVMAGTYRSGVFISKNGGKSWTYWGLYDYTIGAMATDINNPDVVYFGLGEELTSTDLGINKTFDGWETSEWIKAWKSWGECGWSVVTQILVDPDSSDKIYATGIESGYCSSYGGVLISQDGGDTWEDKSTGYKDAVSNIAITKNTRGEKTLFVIDGGTSTSFGDKKLLKSGDMGDTWQEVESPYSEDINPKVLLTNPANSSEVIIGSYYNNKPLWTYNNETEAWDYIIGDGLPASTSPRCVEMSPDGDTFYLATLHGGIYRFVNGSDGWDKINIGFNNSLINDLVVNPNNCNNVYAVSEEELKLHESTDAGSSWNIRPSNFSSSFDILSIDPNNPSFFYAAKNVSLSGYYLFKGENYGPGQMWTGPFDFVNCVGNACYTEITDILIKPGDSDCVLVGSKPYFLSPGGLTGFGVVARTVDGGSSWDKLFESPATALAVDPENSDIIYIGKERGGQVFKVSNAWANRSMVEITPDEGIENVKDIIVDNQSNVFAATEDGLWKRSGETWTKLNTGITDITALVADNSNNPSVIFAGTAGSGVLVSEDEGENWMPFNSGLGNLEITKLVVCGNMIYAGTNYGGAWSREIPDLFTPPFLTHNTGNLRISVFQNGSFGHAAPNWEYGNGLVYQENIDPLFNSGLIFGTSERGTVNGQLGVFNINSDFQNLTPISGVETKLEWDQIATCSFNDNSSASPYGLEITQRSYSKNGEDLLLVKYSIKNTSEAKEDLYVGLFADWDVGGEDHHDRNKGGFDLPRNLAYQYLDDGNPDPNYYGIVALEGISGTRITGKGHPLYIRDSSFMWISKKNTAEITEAGEYRMWIGSGPYNLKEDGNLGVCFAYVVGVNLEELQENADLAAQGYQDLLTDAKETKLGSSNFSLGQNYPNPFSQQTEIMYSLPKACLIHLEIYDVNGVKIKSLVNSKQLAGQYSVKVNTENLSSGIYFYRLKAGNFAETKKMVIK